MRNRIFPRPCFFVLGFFLAASAHANLVTNGSFETAPTGDISPGSSSLTGWDVTGPATVAVYQDFSPTNGIQMVDLTGGNDQSIGSIEQLISTNVGWTYRLTFDAQHETRFTDAGILATFGTETISHTGQRDSQWHTYSVIYTATAPSTNLRFETITGGRQFAGLDNVRVEVEAVPEPASLAALGVGALALLRRRRAQ